MGIKFITTGSLTLAYIEKNTAAPKTIFFIHGNSGSSRIWQKQFNSNQFDNYRCIAIDLPGCGDSVIDKKVNWDYSPVSTGKIIAAAINELHQGNPFGIVGFSYGSNVVAESLRFYLAPGAVSLLSSCVVGAHYGLDKVFMPGDFIFFHDEVKENVVRNFFASVLISPSENDISVNAEDFFKARPPFRSALIKSVGEGKLTDEIAVLKKMNLPVQVIFGKEDSLLQIDYLDGQPFPFWRNNVFKLPGAGHFVHNDQSETLNNLLSEYLGELL